MSTPDIIKEIHEAESQLKAVALSHTRKCPKCGYEYDHMFLQCPNCHPRTCALFPIDELKEST